MAARFDIKKHFASLLISSIVGLAAGYYVLEVMATWEKMPLGQVFYIIVGCVLIAVSGIALIIAIKLKFFPKKRRKKGSKPVFLEDQKKKRRNPDQKNNL